MSRSASREIRCGLCGHRFDAAALTCHSGCPLGSHCNLICCPNCGYQVVDASRTRIGGLLGRILRREPTEPLPAPEREHRETIPLSHVLPGREVEIVTLTGMSAPRAARLGAFGVVPGSRIEVVQRRPTPVVRVGETEFALDIEILDGIDVAPPDPEPDLQRSLPHRKS
jgi:Fe2+ transport system protein FeoA